MYYPFNHGLISSCLSSTANAFCLSKQFYLISTCVLLTSYNTTLIKLSIKSLTRLSSAYLPALHLVNGAITITFMSLVCQTSQTCSPANQGPWLSFYPLAGRMLRFCNTVYISKNAPSLSWSHIFIFFCRRVIHWPHKSPFIHLLYHSVSQTRVTSDRIQSWEFK